MGSTEQICLGRILDAAANRAREALRVLEDYCRFTLNDAILSGELKRLRHELAAALAVLPDHHLLEARETERDVGRELTASGEESRQSLEAVLRANCKRLQEALRSLEEFGKVRSSELGQRLEKLRYESYTLERAIALGARARERLAKVRLCVLITESACAGPMDRIIQEAAAGGAGMIQLREKDLNDKELLESARKVRQWTSQAGVLFIVNDRPDIAFLANADGVHLGQDDMPVMEARQILGPDRLIGVSTHSLDQVRQAVLDGANYIGVGPMFPSGTKDFPEFPGLDFVREAIGLTSLPAFAIGGISVENVNQAAAVEVQRIAVSQAVCQAVNPSGVAQEILRHLQKSV
jgi:thiamine-phosphate pyrophosphorylase